MRLKPRRGEKHKTITGETVTFLEVSGNVPEFCRVLNDKGFMITIKKDTLLLPIIDTKDYEKIGDDKYSGD